MITAGPGAVATAGGVLPPTVLVVGGCSGLVGRALLREFAVDHRIRSLHRNASVRERSPTVEPVRADASEVEDWRPYLSGVQTVVILAWYRQARRATFVRLANGLLRLVRDAVQTGVPRLVHLSVPPAPERLERELPYLSEKRRVDAAVASSGLSYAIVRPTMLFGPGDKLLTVMLRTLQRYRRLPMFGDGGYHVSPVAASDLAAVVRREAAAGGRRTVTVGGPRRWEYRQLTDRLFELSGRPPRYLRMSPRNGVRLARLLELVGSSLLYAYEVDWLVSDLLGLAPYEGLGRPLLDWESFIEAELRANPVRSGHR